MLYFKKSPWIIHYDASSCNGCDIEVLASLTPMYDLERFGIMNTGNPKHADVFLVTGSVNEQNKEVIKNIYHELPEPKVVVAVGICACSGGIFSDCYNVYGGVDTLIPIDVYIPGCAVKPEAIIDGVMKALGILEEKYKVMKITENSTDQMIIEIAKMEDMPAILTLQKIAFRSEAEIYNDFTIPALNQTLGDINKDFKTKKFLKAVINGKIVGSVRAYLKENYVFIERLVVHPYFQNKGIGTKLLNNIETYFPNVKRNEISTGHLSKRNIHLYERLGYKIFKTEKVSEVLSMIYMEKIKQ